MATTFSEEQRVVISAEGLIRSAAAADLLAADREADGEILVPRALVQRVAQTLLDFSFGPRQVQVQNDRDCLFVLYNASKRRG